MNIQEALNEINDQIIDGAVSKQMHPIGLLIYLFSGKSILPSLTHATRVCKENCNTIRGVMDAYVQKRKRGEVKSHLAEGTDLLTLFLKSPEIFTDDFIVDELLDFFLAGI